MMSYKDRTYCSSGVEKHTCGRELSKEDKENAERLGLLVAYGDFCWKPDSRTLDLVSEEVRQGVNDFKLPNPKTDEDLQWNGELKEIKENILSRIQELKGNK